MINIGHIWHLNIPLTLPIFITCLVMINENLCDFVLMFLSAMPIVNTLFITLPSFFISYVAAQAFLRNNSLSVLLLGCAFLISGFGGLLAGWLLMWTTSPNVLVTIHNTGVLLSSFSLLASSWMQIKYCTYSAKRTHHLLFSAYSIALILISITAVATVANITPIFFIQGKGPTVIRQLILGIGTIIYFQSALLLLLNYFRNKSNFMFWYSSSLFIIASGLLIISLQHSVGSSINLLGRLAQYMGYVYAMVAVWAAIKETKNTKEEGISKFFINAEVNYHTLVETANFAIVLTDASEKILIWNSCAEQLFDIKKEDAIGQKLSSTIQLLNRTMLREHRSKDKIHNEFLSEIIAGSKIIHVEMSLAQCVSDYGWTSTYVFKDLTEKKHYERKLSNLSSLDLVGQMAAAIAHEVRNPMTTVRGFLQYYSKTADTSIRSAYALMIEELDRANSIITEYLSLAKNKTSQFEYKKLSSVVQDLYPLLEAYALDQNKHLLIGATTYDIPSILLDVQEIKQLISNMVRNAIEASKPQGVVKITVCPSNQFIVLTIQDNGPGIPDDILKKLGIPFTTTKSNGTGLGLSVCYQIAERHNATIDVDSSSSGTAFHIRFPYELHN